MCGTGQPAPQWRALTAEAPHTNRVAAATTSSQPGPRRKPRVGTIKLLLPPLHLPNHTHCD